VNLELRLLGVTVDNHLSFDQHVSAVVRSCYYHIRSLRHIDLLLIVKQLLISHVLLSLADSITALPVLYGVSETRSAKLQRVQNNLARVVCKSPYNTIVTKLLRTTSQTALVACTA